MKWLTKHPNWCVFFSWLIVGLLAYYAQNNLFLNIIGALIMLFVLAWSLKVKSRSLFNLFYLFIPFIGFLIVWFMGRKTIDSEPSSITAGQPTSPKI